MDNRFHRSGAAKRLSQTHQPIIGFDFKPKQVGAFSDTDGP
jgi:hypothetical protein